VVVGLRGVTFGALCCVTCDLSLACLWIDVLFLRKDIKVTSSLLYSYLVYSPYRHRKHGSQCGIPYPVTIVVTSSPSLINPAASEDALLVHFTPYIPRYLYHRNRGDPLKLVLVVLWRDEGNTFRGSGRKLC
jgi:hypothetical protein